MNEIPLSKYLTPARLAGQVVELVEDHVDLYSIEHRTTKRLNTAAAFIWQQCDGSNSLESMCASVQENVSDTKERIANDVSETVKRLFSDKLVDLGGRRANPLVRIAFLGFSSTFDRRLNFFTRTLSHWLDIILADEWTSADIVVTAEPFTQLRDDERIIMQVGGPATDSTADFLFDTEDPQDQSHAIRLPKDYLENPSATADAHDMEKLRALLVDNAAPEQAVQATGSTRTRALTIGMATYDDYDGVYFSIQSIRLFHGEVLDEIEFLVIDNNPDGPCADALKSLTSWVPHLRYLPKGDIKGTAIRELVFQEAKTDWVVCMDSHVLIEPGALAKLLDYFRENPDTPDLLHGPLLLDNLSKSFTHFEPVWRQGMFGVWASDPRGADPAAAPFEIPMQGLGLAACRRVAWQGYNLRFRGFGGEEGYIHQKFKNAGARNLCLPFLRWLHRFQRPMGTRYENRWEDRIRNYLIGFDEVGMSVEPVKRHFRELVGDTAVDEAVSRVAREQDNPFDAFDAIYCINLAASTERWKQMVRRFDQLGVLYRVHRFDAVSTPENHHIGCALSHRAIIEEARKQGYRNVLVFEDDAMINQQARGILRAALGELKDTSWSILYLGGARWGRAFEKLPGCQHLERPTGLTTSHALAYHHTTYDRLLRDIPADRVAMEKWLDVHRGIDQYYLSVNDLILVTPIIATQPQLLDSEDPDLQPLFR